MTRSNKYAPKMAHKLPIHCCNNLW